MVNKQEASRLSIEIAKLLVELAREVDSNWEKAYFRFESTDDASKANASWVKDGKATIFSVLDAGDLFDEMADMAEEMREHLEFQGKKFAVALVTVDRNFNFNVEYEYDDSNRWVITKMEGGNGFPKGVGD